MTSKSKLDPLREFLDAVVTRIENLETHCGIQSGGGGGGGGGAAGHSGLGASSNNLNASLHSLQKTASVRHLNNDDTPSLKAYSKFLTSSVYPLADTCDSLEGLKNLGDLLIKTFEGMRYVVVLASRSKKPEEPLVEVLTPHLQPANDAVKEIRGLRLDRNFDFHIKAVMEMLACVSWVYRTAPETLPSPFIRECIGSADFWANRIRKEKKGKDDEQSKNHIKFCDQLKKLTQDLADYVKDYHATGLSFNPKGVSIAESAIVLSDNPIKDAAAAAAAGKQQQKKAVGNTMKGANVVGLISELSNRKNEDGTSAATGLKHVTKDQQTWRKEFKKDGTPAQKVVRTTAPPPQKKVPKKKPTGLPILEYQERGTKWVVEHQTKESALKEFPGTGVIVVEISDPKQQVYVYNCEEVTIQIKGAKLKSVILDNCTKVNVIFDTIISACEIVNSKRIAAQVDGICPVFTIDKTVGVTLWLSKESLAVSSYVTSMSSEMNVSFPDGEDRKELPIPEQFVHKLVDGAITSEVSDLYH